MFKKKKGINFMLYFKDKEFCLNFFSSVFISFPLHITLSMFIFSLLPSFDYSFFISYFFSYFFCFFSTFFFFFWFSSLSISKRPISSFFN
jgi:hypothetical protein